MNHILLEKDGKLWYPESYIQEQMELAYRAGLMNGIGIELHECVMPGMEDNNINEIVDRLKNKISSEFHEAYVNGRVWRTAPSYNERKVFGV